MVGTESVRAEAGGEARVQWLVARKWQMQAGVRAELLTTPHVMAIPHGPWSILAVVVTKHFLADSIRAEQRQLRVYFRVRDGSP